MWKFRKILPVIIFLFAANLIFTVSQIPFLNRSRNVPPGTFPTWQHHHVANEYPGYLAYIRQGAEGSWQMHDLYTTEPTTPTNMYLYYILLGKICRVTGLSATVMYHLVRIVQFELLSILIFFLCTRLLGDKAGFIAAILALTGSPPASLWPAEIPVMEGIGWHPWSMLHPFRNADMIPHHGASAVLLLTEVHLYLTAIRKNRLPVSFIAGVAAFFSFLFHPTSGLVFIVSQPLAAVFTVAVNLIRTRRVNIRPLILAAPPAVFSLLAFILVRYDISNSFPFNQFMDFDVVWYDRYNPRYIPLFMKGGGLLLLAGIPSALYIARKRKPDLVTLAFWGLLPFAIIPIGSQLHIAKFRFALLLPFIPLSIVTVYSARNLLGKIGRKQAGRFLIIGLLGLYFFITFRSMAVLYRDWSLQTGKLEPGMYVTGDFRDAVSYLRSEAPPNARILTGEVNGILIPAYVQMITYVAQSMQTLHYEAKKITVREFFGGYLTPSEAADLVTVNGISYIFYGPQEREWGSAHLSYGLNLQPVYQNSTVTVYSVE